MYPSESVKNFLKRADAVCFDVDSTVCTGEGIDDLAEFCGKGNQVKEMTSQAMSGSLDYREALRLRLDLIKPHLNQIEDMNLKKPAKITPNFKELVESLRSKNKKCYLVSGGFDCLIYPVADILGIPRCNVFANRLQFHQDGSYSGFDESQPTSSTGGKAAVIQNLKDSFDYSVVIMVGDGVTDLEACPPADAFIGFGGNVVRETVKSKACWFVMDFQEIIRVL